jgi:dUTP pyrophosphatase
LRIRRLDPGLPMPGHAHPGDAGIDLFAAKDVDLAPFERTLMSTGVAVAIPRGCAGFVQPRSGRAIREGLAFVNSPGLIDSGYRGEIRIVCVNLDATHTLHIRRGERIAQMVVQRVEEVERVEVTELDDTARGEGGLGSTGD